MVRRVWNVGEEFMKSKAEIPRQYQITWRFVASSGAALDCVLILIYTIPYTGVDNYGNMRAFEVRFDFCRGSNLSHMEPLGLGEPKFSAE